MRNIFLALLLMGSVLAAKAQTLPDNIDIGSSSNGVIDLPADVGTVWFQNGFARYTKIQAPNGGAIHFVAQNQLTDAQIVRSRNILSFYLSNVPESQYGSDKSAVANKMADNGAILLLLNGADGQGNEPNINGQYLFADEISVEGSAWYLNNNWEHRDAAFEEILHLMHDTGIGVDGPNSWPGALPEFQAEIRAAQQNAIQNNYAIWPIGTDQDPGWFNELSQENSLSQEYLASLIDSYYGLWGPWTETPGGMWGIYVAKTREDIQTLDPLGWALLPKYFSPYINIDMEIDPTFNGTFTMTFDANQAYTHKSQYLQHCKLTGDNSANLHGNQLYNRLTGNAAANELQGAAGNDRIDGQDGTDTAIFTGNQSEYSIEQQASYTLVIDNLNDRDGVDTLINMETIRFADGDVNLSSQNRNLHAEELLDVYPIPASDHLNLVWKANAPFVAEVLELLDTKGRVVLKQELNQGNENLQINIGNLAVGNYTLRLRDQHNLHGATQQIIIVR